MALTRVTSTVIEDNAVSADKLGNASITGAMIAAGSITADKLGSNVATDGPSATQIAAVSLALSANTNSVKANVDATQANVVLITDATTDLNIGSGKYFFDKSESSFGLSNVEPFDKSITLGTTANIILRHSSKGGNVLIGTHDRTTAFRLDVRGTANTGAITATTVTLSEDAGLVVPNDGNIGSAGAADAMQISSAGIVTFKDDILIKNDGTIGTAGAATAMTIDSSGIVTFVDDIKIKDGGTIGSASAATAMTIASDGIVTFVDDIKIKDAGTIGSASAPTAIGIASDGVVTFVDDIKIKDGGTIGTATTPTAFTIAADGDTAISGGLGVAGNTAPLANSISIGNPANVIIQTASASGKSIIVGDPTGTTSHSLDIRGSANVGALTSTSHTSTGAIQGTTLTATADGGVQVPNDGNIGSAGATDAMQISSAGIVTFKDDIIVKDAGTIGSASAPTAMGIASDGVVTFLDDIKIKDGGTIGTATTPTAITIAADGDTAISGGLGVAGNTSPVGGNLGGISLGTPANVIIRNYAGAGNVIIGDATATSGFNLDVRGTANVGTLTSTSHTSTGALQGTTLTATADGGVQVPNDGNIGSAGATDAMQISSGGIVTFKDDIKIKDGGTIGSATDPAAITIAAAGGVTFSDRSTHSGGITIADGGQIGTATTAAVVTLAADGKVTIPDDLHIGGNLAVLGDTAFVNTTALIVQDNFMALANSQPTDTATSLDSGMFFNRGSAGNAALYYDQSATGFRLSETRDPFSNTSISPTHDANLTLSNLFAQTIQVPNDGKIGSAGSTSAMTISSGGIVTFADDIKIKDGGTIGSATTPAAITVASDGIVTFADDIKIKNDGTIGSAGAATAMSIDSSGIVTFVDDIKIKDGGTIGSATATTAMTIASDGVVTFVDDIKIKDGGTFGTATTPAAFTIAADGDTAISGGLGVAGNTDPATGQLSLGNPANVVIRAVGGKGGNVIIGDVTAVSDKSLDVRGTANVGTLTSTSHTSTGAIQGTTLTATADGGVQVPNDGNIGSAGATDAMQISSGGIVTFKDDIKIKDGGTIGSATTPAAITVASDGIVTFTDDIKIKDDGTIGSASAATAMTIDASGIVTFVDDIKIKDGGTIGVASAADAMTISSAGIVTFKDDILVKDGGTIGSATTADAITVADIGAVTLADDLAVTGNAITTLGVGIAGNTAPLTNSVSLGNPANIIIRTFDASGRANVIIGDPTATTGVSLDVRGSANTGAIFATSILVSGLTGSRALQTNGSGGLESSSVTTAELGRLSGVTSAIQTQLNSKIATTDSASNDFVTFTRLNANVNAVMANVDEKSGTANTNAAALASGIAAITAGGVLQRAHSNSNVQAAGSTANTFFIGAAMPGDGLANILSVSLDGVVQQKDVPSGTFAANNDFVMNAVAAHASIKFTAPSIPVGSTVIITALKA